MNQGPGSTELADSWGVHAQGLWAWAAKLIPRNAGEAQRPAFETLQLEREARFLGRAVAGTSRMPWPPLEGSI